jgi:threonine/homoserine efflux transporter RhtA
MAEDPGSRGSGRGGTGVALTIEVVVRLPRASFALMLALLPMLGTVIGAIVLDQFPAAQDLVGITLVVAGVALHQLPADAGRDQAGA